MKTKLLPFYTFGVLALAAMNASAQYSIDWHTLSGGGGTSTGGPFALSGTIGQFDANPQTLTGGAFSLTGGFWSLFAVQTPDAPLLAIARQGADVRLFWPLPATDFILDQATSLIPVPPTTAWTQVPFPYQTNATHISITVQSPSGNKFYRLRKTPAVMPFSIYSENFNAGDGGFTAETPLPYNGPWLYEAGSGSWTQAGQEADNQQPNTSLLTSPAIDVTHAGVVSLTFAHRYSFESGGWDGGRVRLSVNGGAFTAVPASAFTQNGYNGTVLSNSVSLLHGQTAFVEDSSGFAAGPVTSVCTLGTFQAGDRIRVQFMAASDTNTRGQFQPNWQLDSLSLTVR